MKVGNKVLIKATNEVAIIEQLYKREHSDVILYYARTGGVLKALVSREIVLLSDIAMLDDYKENYSDFVIVAKDSEGNLYSVSIPTEEIANYFECEEIHLTEETDYQDAIQFMYNEWLENSISHDIEVKRN